MKNVFRTCNLTLLLGALLVSTTVTRAQPGKPMSPMGKKGPKLPSGVKRATAIAGHPLTPAQQKTIHAAYMTRKKAMDQYDMTVAKTLGMTVEQYKAKGKALPKKP